MVIPELVDGCQLRCALCWNRSRVPSNNQMSMEVFDKVLEKYGRASRIDWFNWGEPLLHKEFLTIAERLRDTNSRISTNFSLPVSDEYLEALNNFKIVYISLSGMTEQVYRIYHKGGDHGLVFDNIKRFMARATTHVRVRWLIHKHNQHQWHWCRKFCNLRGIRFEPIPLNAEVENLLEESFSHDLYAKTEKREKRTTCHIIEWLPIGWDGRYYLCCASHNVDTGYTVFDDITPTQLIDIKKKLPLCQECQKYEIWKYF